jgi:hypothetical protein
VIWLLRPDRDVALAALEVEERKPGVEARDARMPTTLP